MNQEPEILESEMRRGKWEMRINNSVHKSRFICEWVGVWIARE